MAPGSVQRGNGICRKAAEYATTIMNKLCDNGEMQFSETIEIALDI